jgi:ribosome-binding ATPase YchF (GTP1/OBG family)
MKTALVGYKGSGKSTVFEWLTGTKADLALSHTIQSAMLPLPDPRIAELVKIYSPKKITVASMEVVDTPGLSRTHEGNAARLAQIREAGCLILVVPAYDRDNPASDLQTFTEDLLLADMEIVSGRIGRVQESLKRPIPKQEREPLQHELDTLQKVLAAMESGQPLRPEDMTEDQLKVTRAFRLMSEKPRMVLVNTADDEEHPERFLKAIPEELPSAAVAARLELELAQMAAEERKAFQEEMGVGGADRDALVRRILDVSGQMTFFTAGEKEVRTWLLHKGGTAVEAAGSIHSDLARGFIRAEIMSAADLIRLGSEREVKAKHLVRQEPKDYPVKDDDVLLIRFSV